MWSGVREGLLELMTSELRPEEISVSWERRKRDAELPRPDAEECCVCSRKGKKGHKVHWRH